jgi:magnesium transporter
MLFPMKRRRHTVGMAPGSVVFVGEERTFETTFSLTEYGPEPGAYRTSTPPDVSAALNFFEGNLPSEQQQRATARVPTESGSRTRRNDTPEKRDETLCWLDVCGVHNTSVIEHIGERLGISTLTLEDIANTGQRPKAEVLDDGIFISVKMLTAQSTSPNGAASGSSGRSNGQSYPTGSMSGTGSLRTEQVSLLVLPGGVISFQELPGDVLDPLRQRIQSGRGRIRREGPGYLAYAILDVIVDHYFVVLEALGARAEQLEDEILEDAGSETQQDLNDLRRDLVYVRRHAWPGREMLATLERVEHPLWPEEKLRPFVRDAYEHAVQVLDMTESLRELTSGLTDLYMTTLSNRMNEVMKVLTIIGTIFIPLTFVAGIYGMNFENMPELSAPYGYPIAMSFMGVVAVLLVIYFQRKGWL